MAEISQNTEQYKVLSTLILEKYPDCDFKGNTELNFIFSRTWKCLEISIHSLREWRGSFPHPLHVGPLLRGPPPLLHGARPGPVQQRRVCQRLGHDTCSGRGRIWPGDQYSNV